MNIIQQSTRFLSGLGEIVNILAVAPIAAFAYTSVFDQLKSQGVSDGMMPFFEDPASYMAMGAALIMVGFINGGFAVLFNIRNLMEEKQPDITLDAAPDTDTPDGKAADIDETDHPASLPDGKQTKAKPKKAAKKSHKKNA